MSRAHVPAAIAATFGALALGAWHYKSNVRPPLLVAGDANRVLLGLGAQEDSVGENFDWVILLQHIMRDHWPNPFMELHGWIATAFAGARDAVKVPVNPQTANLEKLTMSDGGTVSIEWIGDVMTPVRAIVLVLPGLNNSSATAFVRTCCRCLGRRGFRAAALNFRGVDGMQLTSSRIGCADSWRDLSTVFDHMKSNAPGLPLHAVGFSMGGGMLLRYLGQEGFEAGTGTMAHITAAAVISAPVDFPNAAKFLEGDTRHRLLNRVMTLGAKKNILAHQHSWPEDSVLDVAQIEKSSSLRELEEAVICPLHNYTDAEDYYYQNSPHVRLPHIRVPTLMIHAKDDPVISVRTLPFDDIRSNRNLVMALTERGGHIGWVPSEQYSGGSWVDTLVSRFLRMHAKEVSRL